jgi:hypothetical protein
MRLDETSIQVEDIIAESDAKQDFINKAVENEMGIPLKTKNGKVIKINVDANGYLYVTFGSGGQVPGELSGKYTNFQACANAVKIYIETDTKPIKEVK